MNSHNFDDETSYALNKFIYFVAFIIGIGFATFVLIGFVNFLYMVYKFVF